MQNEPRGVGIFGGTFNPVHYGHLIISEVVRQQFDLSRVVFIPSGMPPHKSAIDVSGAEHRFNMVSMAICNNSYFEVSRIELDRVGYTYTIDTLTELKKVYSDTTKLFFIIGADIIKDLLTWREPDKIFGICEFIAVTRPGYPVAGCLKEIENLRNMHMAKIHMMTVPLIDISSSGIRERIQNGRSIKYLVPECVEKYIIGNGLYYDNRTD